MIVYVRGCAERATLAFAKTNSVLFVIPQADFLEARAAVHHAHDRADDVNFIAAMPWMKPAPIEALLVAAFQCATQAHTRGSTVLTAGSCTTCALPVDFPSATSGM